MAANRFDQAAEMPIINTYVPIDFNNLYQIGAVQRQAVDKAINDLNEAITTFGEFRSPSSVDTQRYYDLSLGRMQGLIDEVTANPDSHTFKTLIQSYERHFNTPKYLTFFNAAFQQNESLKEIKKYIKISTNSPKQTILYKAKSIIGFQSNDNGDGFILFQNLGSDYFKFSASDVSPISEDVVLESLKENWIFAFYSKENDLNSPYETIIYKPISSHCDESLKSPYKVRLKSFSCVLKVPKTFQKFLMRKTNLCFYALNSML